MIDGNSEIHAVGYIDAMTNPDDEAGGVSQDPEGYNRVGWTSVNGVTTPAAIQELNLSHTGPMFVEELSPVVDIPPWQITEDSATYTLKLGGAPEAGSLLAGLWLPHYHADSSLKAENLFGLPKNASSLGSYTGDSWNS